jgi:DNA-binding IclR family transcriptional regulator
MRDLASLFDETVNLGLLDQGQVIYLDKLESRELLRMDSGIGTACRAYASALGKSMLAFLPKQELDKYIDEVTLTSFTANTIDSREKLVKELAKIRKHGYAVDNEELAQELYCVGAPIFDLNGYPSFALSVSGPVRRIKNMKGIPGRLMESTQALSRQLGFPGGVRL